MWLLLLLAISTSNPNDIPARITLRFDTEQQCIQAATSMTYWLKFDSFKVTAQCQKS